MKNLPEDLILIDKRHTYLERRALNPDNEWNRCYCGVHLDEKAEIISYRRQVKALELGAMTPFERLITNFEEMSPQDREILLNELINGGA